MSDREFENYLALLSSLLRLDRKQRASIADELRAHLEDRLEELLARGVSHDDAVRQALAEFGDAAGLAGQFGAISRNRKRRWVMRLTTFSVAATLLFAAGLAIFWPGRNAAPGVANAIGQVKDQRDPFAAPPAEKAASTEKDAAKNAKPASRRTAAAVIDDKLNQMTTLDVVEMPLKDVVVYLQETHQLPIILKQKKLEEASVSLDTPITKSLNGIRLAAALDIILEDLNLAYYTTEVLHITTPADAQTRTEVRIYDCRDILVMPAPGKAAGAGSDGAASAMPMPGGYGGGMGMGRMNEHDHRAERLMNIITTNIDQQSWSAAQAEQPGNGSISEYNGLIVVTQTAQTHKKIEHVLNMLREAAGLVVPSAGSVVR
jgi:hypothetical protein